MLHDSIIVKQTPPPETIAHYSSQQAINDESTATISSQTKKWAAKRLKKCVRFLSLKIEDNTVLCEVKIQVYSGESMTIPCYI